MTSHVRRRRKVAQQLSSATTRVSCWIRCERGPVHVRLAPRPAGDASSLSRDASTQVAASRTMPPHEDGGGRRPSDPDSWGSAHAVPQVPSALATRAPRRCARGARVRDEERARREGTRMRRSSRVKRAIEWIYAIRFRDCLSACAVVPMVLHG